ncbi:S-layer homology domain-containing protein [Cohnella zeiphila]|uniref:S-layer homology domain-containing protein n=1 Tax=Cohnella zeiphila TaxID=2761120 RepID=UPI001EE16276|nr:S-layer homology domain-containing protein [Cohnella zeiphila]
MTLIAGGATESLTATVAPENATNKNVTWSSSDANVATVANGVVTPVSAGTATITVTTQDGGYTASSTLTVSPASAPVTVPGAPMNVTATAGNGQATVTFMAPDDNGGSTITRYVVTATPGGQTATGTSSPIVVTGLTNGTTYTFTVKAFNLAGGGAVSAASPAVTPVTPSSGGGGTPVVATPGNTQESDVEVLVNGKVENAGKATTTTVNNQTVTTVTVDPDKLNEKLAAEGNNAVVTIPVNTGSDVVIGELNGQMVKNMEQKQAVVEIKTQQATYSLPAGQIDIDSISNQLGQTANLEDIKIQIQIAAPSAEAAKAAEDAASVGGFTPVAAPVEFTVKGTYNGQTVEVSRFNSYVERTIAIPDGGDPNQITTGIVIDPDGTVRHVPTKITTVDGKHFAVINSLTNSLYSVVWHPIEFSDVQNHWAKDAVNDMGSRMIVDGTGDGLYSPNRNITRAELAAIIVRALGLKVESGSSTFTDVNSSAWYAGAVQTAYDYKLINGFGDGLFRPQEEITREQAMAIIDKAMTVTGLQAKLPQHDADASLSSFVDAAKVSSWAKEAVDDSLQAGIVTGRTGSELDPQADMTRAEIAAMIQRLLQKSDLI